MSELETLIEELETLAGRLRSGDLDAQQAAGAVERLAEIAARVGGELEREARAPVPGEPPGQESLL